MQETTTPVQRTPRDLQWAADVFEERGKVNTQGKLIVVQVNTRVTGPIGQRLQNLFGGALYPFGQNTIRWQVTRDELQAFLASIEPFLTDAGREKVQAVRTLQATLTSLHTRKAEAAPPPLKVDAFRLLDGVDLDQLALVEDEFDAIEKDPEGRALLRSKNREHTHDWTTRLIARGYAVSVTDDVFIHVSPKDVNA